jgi:hypothetical protein
MKLEFVNHASFILEEDDVRMITDPWYEGSVFDNSWSLLLKSKFKTDDFSGITHIWFSHEHPDHFFPPNLTAIPEFLRSTITILYRSTKDKKVYNYCKKLGFKVIELPKLKWLKLSSSVKIKCIPWYDDSLLMIETPSFNILNLNDCTIKSKNDAIKIHKQLLPKVDFLFTQYSYASYVGENFDDRKRAAQEKLEDIANQISVFNPKKVIPFASNVWFSHSENFHMNDAVNKIEDACNFINTFFPSVEVLVMAPGDVYDPRVCYDNSSSLKKYSEAYKMLNNKEKWPSKIIAENQLFDIGLSFVSRLKKLQYYKLFKFLGLVKPLRILVIDLDIKVELSFNSFEKISNLELCHISMTSSALEFALKYDYGFNTLSVNGRYSLLGQEYAGRFDSFLSLGDAMNHGRYNYIDLFGAFVNRAKLMLGLK